MVKAQSLGTVLSSIRSANAVAVATTSDKERGRRRSARGIVSSMRSLRDEVEPLTAFAFPFLSNVGR